MLADAAVEHRQLAGRRPSASRGGGSAREGRTDDEKPSFLGTHGIDGDWICASRTTPPLPDWVPFDTSGLAGRDVVQKIDVMGRRAKNR